MSTSCSGNIIVNPPASCSGIYGDVNEDGAVTILDAQQVAQYVAGTRTFTPCQLKKADVDGDGVVTATDVQYISNYTVGSQPYGKCGQPV